jgi:hypothetical protein
LRERSADEGAVRKKKLHPQPALDPKEATREALDFCFEDVSSMNMLGSAPLSDLTSGRGPGGSGSGAGPAGRRSGEQRWNLVMLAALLLTLGASTAVMLLGH